MNLRRRTLKNFFIARPAPVSDALGGMREHFAAPHQTVQGHLLPAGGQLKKLTAGLAEKASCTLLLPPGSDIRPGDGIVPANGAHGTLQGMGPVSVHGSAGGVTGTLILRNASVLAGGMEYTPPEYVTKSFPISKHCTYVYGDKRIRDDQSIFLSQGRYGAYETASHMTYWRTGAMWFAEATQVLQGKTIQSATLKLRRASGGWSGAVNVYLGSVALSESDFSSTTKPAFTPAANYPMGTLKRETEAIYDVTGLMSAVQSGHALGVFEPRDDYASGEGWSPAYTNFYGKGSEYEPVLTVTYK